MSSDRMLSVGTGLKVFKNDFVELRGLLAVVLRGWYVRQRTARFSDSVLQWEQPRSWEAGSQGRSGEDSKATEFFGE